MHINKILTLATFVVSFLANQIFAVEANIDQSKTFQTIENFTAADAWSGNFVGKFFSEEKRGQIAKWLFSQKFNEDGSPEGIGLSMWRFNIGGGTWEQENPDIEPIHRRAESFLSKDGKSYDWNKAQGQQYFMKAAKEYGCNTFLLFSNTPPIQMTQNSKGYKDTSDFKSNLRTDCYDDFAEYMAEVAKHFADEGFNIAYISPVNEPSWKWATNAQEGTPWLNPEIKRLAIELDKSIQKRNLSTMIMLCEADSIQNLYGYDRVVKENKNLKEDIAYNQIQAFFDPSSKDYIGYLKSMPRKIGGHDYHTDTSNQLMISTRKSLKECADKYGVTFIQTEWCMLPNVKVKDAMPEGKYSDMDKALVMTRLIHTNLTITDTPSWGYWKAMEINGAYALTAVFPKNGDLTQGGEVATTKKLWALGNYSFFIRPDWKRIFISGADDISNVFASAFISPDGKKIAVVAGNITYQVQDLKLNLKDENSSKFNKISAFRTSKSANLANLHIDSSFKNGDSFKLAPRSMNTFLLEIQ